MHLVILQLIFVGNSLVMLQADTGKYLSRISRGSELDAIEATKSEPDVFCQFTVSVVSLVGKTPVPLLEERVW